MTTFVQSPGSGSPCSLSSPTTDQEYRDPLSLRSGLQTENQNESEVIFGNQGADWPKVRPETPKRAE